MSTVVDQRVVSMEFDNKHFEKNVQTSMSTIDKLKQKLNFKGATKGLESIKTATDEVVKSEYEAYQSGFKLRDVWLKTASIFEYQVAGRIISAAKNMVKAFTIDPIKTGLSEYETQLNSVQTILANTESKGSTLEDVNAALDELNAYADKTIYNFTEMTRNIGTFTAAGVDLDTSVSAIKGIANLAAVSGSTSQQASTAMYQLSQALASGTVKLMDWNSVVNAGMGGQIFQDALKETARVHGIAIDEIIKNNGSFRESLQEGWLTSEILTETLSKFTGDLSEEQLKSMGYTQEQIKEIMKLGQTANDAATKVKTFTQLMDTLKEAAQSGWAQTFEIIIGDFEEAKELWTEVSDVLGGFIGNMSDARNELLSGALNSGWDQLMDAGIMDETGYSHYVIQEAKKSGIAIDEMIEKHGSLEKALREGFKDGTIETNVLSGALDQLTNVYANCSEEELKRLGYTKDQVKALMELNAQVKNGTISMEEFAEKMSQLSGRELLIESLKNIFKALVRVIQPVADAFGEIFPAATADQLYNALKSFHEFTERLKLSDKAADNLKRTFKGLFAAIDLVITIVKPFVKFAFKLLGAFGGLLGIVFDITAYLGDFIVGIRDCVKGVDKFSDSTESLTDRITGFIKNAIGKLRDFINVFLDVASFDNVESGFVTFLEVFQKVWSKISKILHKIGDLFKAVFGFIGSVVREVTTYINQLFENTFAAATGNSNGAATIFDLLTGLVAGGLGVGLIKLVKNLSKVVKSVKEIFVDGLADLMDGFKDLIDGLTDTLKSFQTQIKAEAIMKIAKAVLMLVGAMIALAFVPEDKLITALTAIGVLIGMLTLAVSILNKSATIIDRPAKTIKESITNLLNPAKIVNDPTKKLVRIAAAILILSFALRTISKLSWEQIARGLVAMTGVMVLLIGSVAILNKLDADKAVKGTEALRTLSKSLLLIAASLYLLALLSWNNIGKGLFAMTATLTILVGAVAIISKIERKGMSGDGTNALMKLAKVLLIIGAALHILALLSWKGIAKGLVAIAGTLTIMVGVLAVLEKLQPKTENLLGNQKGINQLVKMSKMLLILGAALHILALLSWNGIAKGLVAMTVSLGVLVGALFVMSKISKSGMSSSGATQLVIAATSLTIIAAALQMLGSISWENIGKSLLAMTVALGVLIGALAIIAMFPVSSAVAMVAIAGAVAILAPALAFLGTLELSTIAKGALAIAAAFAALAVGLMVLSPVIMVAALLGTAMLLVAASIAIMAPAIALLAISLPVFAASLSASVTIIGQAIIVLAMSIAAAIPIIIAAIGRGLIALCEVIILGAPAIAGAIVSVVVAIIDTLTQLIPSIAAGLFEILVKILGVLVQYIPQIVAKLVEIIVGIITTLTKYLPVIVEALFGFFGKLIEEMVKVLIKLDPAIILQALVSIGILAAFLLALSAITLLVPGAIVGVLALSVFIGTLGVALTALGVSMILLWPFIKAAQIVLEAIADILEPMKNVMALAALIALITPLLPAAILGTVALNLFVINLAAALTSLSVLIVLTPLILLAGVTLNIIAGSTGPIIAMMGLMALMNVIAILTPAALVGVAGFTAFVFSLTAALSAMAPLILLLPLIQAAGVVLEELGKALGKFIAGFAEGVTSTMPQIGTHFSDFMKNLEPFLTILETLDSDVIKNGNSLIELLKTFASIGTWLNIGSIFGNEPIDKLVDELIGLAEGLVIFDNNMSNVRVKNIEKGVQAGKLIAELAHAIPNSGGLVAFFAGDNDLKTFGEHLGVFGEGLNKFAQETKGITDTSQFKTAAEAGKIICDMMNQIPLTGGMTTWFEGDNDLKTFGEHLGYFGEGLAKFDKAAGDADGVKMKAAAEAGTIIAKMTQQIDDSGGLVAGFIGDNDLKTFGEGVGYFGEGIAKFAEATLNCDGAKMKEAAEAGVILAKMTQQIDDSGGLVAGFIGDNDLKTFGQGVGYFGEGIAKFAEAVNNADGSKMKEAAAAGIILAEMSQRIDNTGGLGTIFTGDNNLGNFGTYVAMFGDGLAGFAEATKGIDAAKVSEAAKAGMIFAEMSQKIDNNGGVRGFFEGDNDLKTFGEHLGYLGEGLLSFQEKTKEVKPNKIQPTIDVVDSIVDVVSKIPKATAIDNFRTDFANHLKYLGWGIADFAREVSKEDVDYSQVPSAINAAHRIINAITRLPKTDDKIIDFKSGFADKLRNLGWGIADFAREVQDSNFDNVPYAVNAAHRIINTITRLPKTDDNLIDFKSGFADKLKNLGWGIADFADKVALSDFSNIGNATIACDDIAETIKNLPTTDSKVDVKKFSERLGGLGQGIADFATNVAAVTNPSQVKAVAESGVSIVKIADEMASAGEWFNSDFDSKKFGEKLSGLGTGITNFSNKIASVSNADQIRTVSQSAVSLFDMAGSLPVSQGLFSDKFNSESFKSNLITFGEGISGFVTATTNVTSDQVSSVVGSCNQISDMLENVPELDVDLPTLGADLVAFGNSLTTFINNMSSVETVNSVITLFDELSNSIANFAAEDINYLVNTIDTAVSGTKSALTTSLTSMFDAAITAIKSKIQEVVLVAKTMMTQFIEAVKSYAPAVASAFESVIDSGLSAINNENIYTTAYSSGTYVVGGLTQGIWDSAPSAIAAATSLATSVNTAIQSAFLINSPSKVMYDNGTYIVQGLTNSLYDHETDAYDAGYGMADNAKNGIQKAISKVSSIIENGIDAQPTIRPVLDLSDFNTGIATMNNALGMSPSVGLLSRVGSINKSMNKNQNGDDSETISLLKDISNKLDNMDTSSDVYNINGVTYDDGSSLQEAVKTILRAARIERRV